MFMTDAAGDSLVREKYKHQIRKGIDDLCRVDGSVVVLEIKSAH
jgi:hypothetical protein